ncbi:MAG: right-handed parallel beta-helix repeat-containing protein [Pseudolysinimonas sp.]
MSTLSKAARVVQVTTGVIMNRTIPIAIAALVTAAFLAPAASASATDLCGVVVTTPGTSIVVTEDLHCAGSGITVRANNVTIDLAGHTIYGSGSDDADPILGFPAGVVVYGATNTQVRGGTLTGFAQGMTVMRSTVTTVQNLTINGTKHDGMGLTDSSGVSLSNLNLTGLGSDWYPATGIVGTRVTGFSIDTSVISQWSGDGLFMDSANGFTFARTSVLNNVGTGISLWQPRGRVLIDQATAAVNDDGIAIAHSSTSGTVTISNSTIRNNVENGLHTTNATNARVVNVTANNNGSEGIWMDSGIDASYGGDIPFTATVQGSTANGNRHSGISMSFAGRWTLTGNHTEGNGESGFSFWGGAALLSGNTSKGNTENGFTWYEGSHGTSTGDVASSNHGHGVLVNTNGKDAVRMLNASVTSNRFTGVLVSSGIGQLIGGSFAYNGSDGIRASHGYVNADGVTAFKNAGSGIAFLPSSGGAVRHVTSSKNGRYGICITKGLEVTDVPPHVLLSNGIAPRGVRCTATILGS